MGKINKLKHQIEKKPSTPQYQKKGIISKVKKTPRSEPQPKRKKIAQEIEDAISDEEFDKTTMTVKEQEKLKKKLGIVTPKPKTPLKAQSEEDESEESDDEEVDLDDLDLDSDDLDISDDEDDSEDEDDDDDDDDNEDSEDDEMKDAGKGKSKLAAKFKEIMEAQGELSSEEDDESEDSEDEEDEPPPTKKKKVQTTVAEKGKKKDAKDQAKGVKSQANDSNQAKKRKHEAVTNGHSVVSSEDLEKDRTMQEDRDSRTLFLKLNGDVKGKSVHKLLSDSLKSNVLDVRIQSMGRAKKGQRESHVYVEFKSKENAAEGHKQLKGKGVYVDFVGKNSSKPEKVKSMKDPEDFDPLRLYVTGFDRKVTVEQLKKVFPQSAKVQLPMRKKTKKNIGYGFVHFKTHEECKKIHNQTGLTCNGRNLVILYAKKVSAAKKADNRPQELEKKVTAKKQKQEAKSQKKEATSAKTKESKSLKGKAAALAAQEESSEEEEAESSDEGDEDMVEELEDSEDMDSEEGEEGLDDEDDDDEDDDDDDEDDDDDDDE